MLLAAVLQLRSVIVFFRLCYPNRGSWLTTPGPQWCPHVLPAWTFAPQPYEDAPWCQIKVWCGGWSAFSHGSVMNTWHRFFFFKWSVFRNTVQQSKDQCLDSVRGRLWWEWWITVLSLSVSPCVIDSNRPHWEIKCKKKKTQKTSQANLMIYFSNVFNKFWPLMDNEIRARQLFLLRFY